MAAEIDERLPVGVHRQLELLAIRREDVGGIAVQRELTRSRELRQHLGVRGQNCRRGIHGARGYTIGWLGTASPPMAGTASEQHAGTVGHFIGNEGELGDRGARSRRVAARGAAGRQAEEQAMAHQVSVIVGAVERGHVEHQVFDALLDQPFDRLAREIGRHEIAVVARCVWRSRWAACG